MELLLDFSQETILVNGYQFLVGLNFPVKHQTVNISCSNRNRNRENQIEYLRFVKFGQYLSVNRCVDVLTFVNYNEIQYYNFHCF